MIARKIKKPLYWNDLQNNIAIYKRTKRDRSTHSIVLLPSETPLKMTQVSQLSSLKQVSKQGRRPETIVCYHQKHVSKRGRYHETLIWVS